jgi:hypothetical protein
MTFIAISLFLAFVALVLFAACWAIGWSEQNFSDYDEPSKIDK